MDTKQTLLIAVLAMGLAGSAIMADTPGEAAEVSPVRLAHIRLSGLIQERPSELGMLFSKEKPTALGEVIDRLAKAKDDKTITAVAIELAEPAMGLAQIQDLVAAIEDVQSGGKDVACFVEQARPGTYLLAASASHVTMPPSGMIVLPGVYGELWYFKGLLDKLGLEADMEQIGAYKGAAEPWMQTEPSPEVREQMTGLVDDLYEQIVGAVVAHRGLTQAKATEAVDLGLMTATQAKQLNLIDEVAFRQDFYKRLDAHYGPKTELVRRYGVEDGPAMAISSPWDLFKLFGQMLSAGPATTTPAIAVVYVEGIITTGRSEENPFGSHSVGSATLRWALDKAREDDSIKAVVLRVDSPGGSALASDIVYNAARRVAAVKPVIVSMGNVAASGGYYIAVAGDEILAQPGTITGSIGVVGGKLILAGLLDKIGITT
ncbi:MAG: S49 family peptidase, partial [Planctomycetes bacterium]|nr:S49 family peptidase [Planctomycetota bacterium]